MITAAKLYLFHWSNGDDLGSKVKFKIQFATKLALRSSAFALRKVDVGISVLFSLIFPVFSNSCSCLHLE